MGKYKIYPLSLGRLIRKEEFPIVSFYLTDGVNHVMVDTGGVPADGINKMPYFQKPGERLEEKLASMGIDPLKINIVIISHLHWDHMCNNHLFPNAKFYLQKDELLYAVAPIPTDKWAFDMSLIIQTDWTLLEGDEEIADGLSVLKVGGHTPGSQCVLVDTEKGVCALTCDFITKYEQWEQEPKRAGDIYTNIIEYYQGLHKLEKSCDFILPGHNDEVLEHPVHPIDNPR